MSEKVNDQENDENVLYGYRTDNGALLWTPNVMFAQARATQYGTFEVYLEKI
jgi:hypothetical protein